MHQLDLTTPFLVLLTLPATAMGFALSVQISALSWILSTQYGLDLHDIGLVWAAGPLAGIAGQVIIGGTAINFLALGLTGYLYIDIYGAEGTPTDISGIPSVNLGFLDGFSFFDVIFGDLNLMIWFALILILVVVIAVVVARES